MQMRGSRVHLYLDVIVRALTHAVVLGIILVKESFITRNVERYGVVFAIPPYLQVSLLDALHGIRERSFAQVLGTTKQEEESHQDSQPRDEIVPYVKVEPTVVMDVEKDVSGDGDFAVGSPSQNLDPFSDHSCHASHVQP